MSKLTRQRSAVKYNSAAEWPSWTDDVRFVPTEADAAWAAENLSVEAQDDGPPADDPVWDILADEFAALDRIERGYCL